MPKTKKVTPTETPESEIAKEEIETLVEEKVEEESGEEKETVEKKETESFSKEELVEEASTPFYKSLFWMVAPVILLAGAIAAGVFIYQLGVKKGMEIQQAVEPTPAPTPTPIPAPILKRENLKVQVLNGAGVAGTAGKAKEFLEELGYKDVDTGNADSYDFGQTEIAIKEDKEEYAKLLKDDLSKEYAVSEDVTALKDDSEYDVIITIGKEQP